MIEVGTSKKLKGIRGMFACEDIKKGKVVEHSPVILVPMNEYEEHIKKTVLEWYYYDWNDEYKVIVLGMGSLFNHSSKPNLKYTWGYKNRVIIYTAKRNIRKGEELFIDYMNDCKGKLDKQFTDFKR